MLRLLHRQNFLAVGVIWFSLTATPYCWSCSFCAPDAGPSLLKQLDSASAAVLATLVEVVCDSHDAPAVSTYRVVTVLKGIDLVDPGAVIEVPLKVQAPPGSVHLFFGDGEKVKWRPPLGVSPAAREFLSLASKLPEIGQASGDHRVQRLGFMLPYLVSKDSQIVDCAYGEFAAASDSAVSQLKPVLNPRMLRAWIELEGRTAQERRLFFTLLGVCGNSADLPFVEAAIDDRLEGNDYGDLDAILATYLTLAGSAGLNEIDRRLLEPDDIPIQARRAAINAFRFHVENESVLDKDRMIASFRLLLKDPNSADFVIRDLTRWEDWKSLNAVLSLQSRAGEMAWLRRPIAEYLSACPLPTAQAALEPAKKER